jgi:hypothetical protein
MSAAGRELAVPLRDNFILRQRLKCRVDNFPTGLSLQPSPDPTCSSVDDRHRACHQSTTGSSTSPGNALQWQTL